MVVPDEFPMTVTGKVRKVEMREKSVEILRLPHSGGPPHSSVPLLTETAQPY